MFARSSTIWKSKLSTLCTHHRSLSAWPSIVTFRRKRLQLPLVLVWLLGLLGAPGSTRTAIAAPSPASRSLERAAIEAAALGSSVTRSLRLRMHLAQLLPQLRVTFGRGWQLTTSRDYLIDTPQTDNDRVNYALSASWDLARLISPHGELSLLKEEQSRAQLRHRLLERVAQLSSERCVLAQRPRPLSRSDEQRRLTIEATLSILTGGRVSLSTRSDEHCPASPERQSSAAPTQVRTGTRPTASEEESVEDSRPSIDPDRITDE